MTKSTSSNEPFRYRSLDKVAKEIRIIVLHPAHSQSAEIQCDIWHTRLGRRCNYIALSYTWGDPEHKHTILVNSRKFEVTTNLRDALCYLRTPERPLIFWIDAICINQDDIDERSQQVQIMRDIYSGAECVYAWIGCADSFSPVACNFIQNLATRISDEGMKLTKTTTAWIASQVSPSLEDGAFRALVELIDRPWFKRVWVIQEVVVSKETTVCCGNLKLPWTDFELTAAAVHGYLATIEKTLFAGLSDKSHPFESSVAVKRFEKLGDGCMRIRIIATSIRERLENKGPKTLNHIIQKFRSSESTDPRDKIYALLGIATGLDIEVSQIPVDYRQDVGDLCRSFTRCQLEYHKSLDVLSDCSGDVNSERFSSWSICLQNSGPLGVIWLECGKEIVFRAGSGYKPCFSFGRTGRNLKVRGIYFDEIKQIGDLYDHLPGKKLNEEPYIPSTILMRWQNLVGVQVLFENSIEETPDTMRRLYFEQGFYPTGEPRALAFLHTITMDNTTNGDSTQFFDIEMGINLEYLDQRNRENAKEKQSRIKARIASTCMKKRFFCTSKGFYGLTAPNIKQGDKICIFFGCKTPSVVRREGGSYILLGDAYVEGLMRGEAVTAWKAGKLRSKVFSLQ